MISCRFQCFEENVAARTWSAPKCPQIRVTHGEQAKKKHEEICWQNGDSLTITSSSPPFNWLHKWLNENTEMLKHMLNTNGGVGNRVSRPDSSMVMEPRLDQSAHRYRSPNTNNISRISQPYTLNVSQLPNNLDTSKHSIYSNALLSPAAPKASLNGGLNISRVRNQSTVNKFIAKSKQVRFGRKFKKIYRKCTI